MNLMFKSDDEYSEYDKQVAHCRQAVTETGCAVQ